MGIIVFSPGGQKPCTSSLYAIKIKSVPFSLMTFPSNLKALKANVICYMAKREKPFSQQYLQRVQSVPFLKILKAWTKRD